MAIASGVVAIEIYFTHVTKVRQQQRTRSGGNSDLLTPATAVLTLLLSTQFVYLFTNSQQLFYAAYRFCYILITLSLHILVKLMKPTTSHTLLRK